MSTVNYDNINLKSIKKLETSSKILEVLQIAIKSEKSVKDAYMDAFVNACIHAVMHDNHCIVNTCFLKVPSNSIYKSKIKKWIEEYTPLKWSKPKEGFIRKTIDGKKKASWNPEQIDALISNPFYESKQKETETEYSIDSYFNSINKIKNLAKLTIKKFEESSIQENHLKDIESISEDPNLEDTEKELAIELIESNYLINIDSVLKALSIIEVELSKRPEGKE